MHTCILEDNVLYRAERCNGVRAINEEADAEATVSSVGPSN